MFVVWVLIRLTGIGLIGSIVLPVYACWRWRGRWRLAAFVPLGALALLILPLVPIWARDPTAYNLWGLLLIVVELLMCFYMATIVYLHWRHHKPAGIAPEDVRK
jgi:hypothetical protein